MNQTEEFNQHIAEEYIKSLGYQDSQHPRALITFSGIPASGKTTLARRLTDDLRAQYVQNDGIRQIISSEGKEPRDYAIIPITHRILKKIYEKDRNKYVVLDSSLDRSWRLLFENAKIFGVYPPIIIRFNVSHETLKSRQKIRDNVVHERFEDFVTEFEECKRLVKADIELDEVYDYATVLEQVKKLLEIRL